MTEAHEGTTMTEVARDYVIMYGRSTEFIVAAAQLEDGVKRKIAEGWTVTGGVAFAHTEIRAMRGEEFLLMQAMVRESKEQAP